MMSAYWKFVTSGIKLVLSSVINKGKIRFDTRCVVPLSTVVEASKGAEIIVGRHSSMRRGCVLAARDKAKLYIGTGVSLNYNCILTAYNKIEIGDGTIVGPNVCVYDHDHVFGSGIHDNRYNTAEVSIGRNVWIGAGCTILMGTSIGDGAVIGAGSIIKGYIPEGTIVIQKRENSMRSISDVV